MATHQIKVDSNFLVLILAQYLGDAKCVGSGGGVLFYLQMMNMELQKGSEAICIKLSHKDLTPY